MRQITTINDYPKQSFFITIENYESADVTLEFKPSQQGWFMNLTWRNIGIKQMRVVAGPNILQQFSKVLPFGIAVSCVDDLDPFAIDSWLTVAKFYVLDQADLDEVEALYVR